MRFLLDVNHRSRASDDDPCCATCIHSTPDRLVMNMYACRNREAVDQPQHQILFLESHVCDLFEGAAKTSRDGR